MNDVILNKQFVSNLAATEEPDPDAVVEFAFVVPAVASPSVAETFAVERVVPVGVGTDSAVSSVTSPLDIVYVGELMLPVPPKLS